MNENKNNKEKKIEMKQINYDEDNNFLSLKIGEVKNYNFKDLNNEMNNDKNDKEEKDLNPYYLKYKPTKFLCIKFYHIGNTYVFGFINNFSEPLFCIDNLWYLHLIIYFIEFIVYFLGNKFFYSNIEHWKQIIFNILLMFFFILYSLLILLNQGIIIKNQKRLKPTCYCNKCNIYYFQEEKVIHCSCCNICVRNVDHHCHVIRKCITKKNIIIFYLMVGNFMILYLFTLINFIIYIIIYFTDKKK